MRRQFAEDAFVVVGLPLLVGLHVSGLEFDTVSVKLLSSNEFWFFNETGEWFAL